MTLDYDVLNVWLLPLDAHRRISLEDTRAGSYEHFCDMILVVR